MMPLATDVITQGTMRSTSGATLPLEQTDVEATLNGPIASVTVRQRFRNTSDSPIEAEYMFPLPHTASVHTMRFQIGERVVEGAVKEKEEAKRAYEAARREGRSATLLEQDRPNLFTLSVANIAPADVIEVTLGYQEKLGYDDGEWRFVFPMVTTERYHEGNPDEVIGQKGQVMATTAVPDAGKIRPPAAATGKRPSNVHVKVQIEAGEQIEPPRSPSHRIDLDQISESAYRLALHESEGIANRDFVVAYRAVRKGIRPRAYFERQMDRMGTFLLVVTPPVPDIEDISLADAGPGGDHRTFRCNNCGGGLRDASTIKEWPGIGPAWKCEYCGVVVAATREQAKYGLPRDVIFLVDRSCSMRGQSVPQAKRAVRMILDHLGPQDRAQAFAFDHDRIAADGRGETFVPVTKEWILQIDEFFRGIQARGGSELEEALERAAKLPTEKGRTRVVVLITDGAVGNEGRLLRRVPDILGRETRLYVLGIGPAVNRYLVERLARAGGGTSDVLLPGEDIETVIPKFARRVRQAGPVLTNIRLSWDDAMPVDVYPNPVPELFGGQTVELFGRFAGSGKSRLILTGARATGESFRQEIDVELPEESKQMPGLERLWARLRIDARLERLNEAPHESAEIRMEVLALALKHKLLSPYTALVAEVSEKRVSAPAKKVQMAAVTDAFEDGGGGGAFEELKGEGSAEFTTGAPPPLDDDEDMLSLGAMAPPGAAPRPAAAAAPMRARSMESFAGGMAPPGAPPAFGAPPPPIMATAERLRSESLPAPKARGGGILSAIAGALGFGGEKAKKELKETIDEPKGYSSMDDEAPPTPRDPDPFDEDSFFADSPAAIGGGRSAPIPAGPPAAHHAPPPQQSWSPPLESSQSESYTPEMLAQVAKAGIGEIDLVFLVDETGSMGAYIEEVKRRLLDIIETIQRAPLCRSLRLGIVSYRDHPPQDRSFASRVVPLTDDIASIKKGVARMQASGGGDGPESVTDGLYDLVRLDWRPRAARVVVWVGDAPPHGVEPSGDAFPNGCPCGHHWYAQAENAREMGIVIHAVGCLPALREYRGAEDVFKTVAKTSRGLYLPLSQASLLIPLITGVAETELDKQRIEEHIANVLKQYEKDLAAADQDERVRFVTDVLRQQNVKPRGLVYSANAAGASPQRFREITRDDVEEGLERLRRTLRTSL